MNMKTTKQQAVDYMKAGKYIDAISLLVQLEKDEIKDWTLYYALGQCYRFSGQLTSAYQFLETAKQVNRLNAEIAYAFGEVSQLMFKNEEAVRAFEDVISLHPNRIAAYNKIGLIYARTGNIEEALAWFHRGMDRIALLEHAGVDISDEAYRHTLKATMELGFVFPHAKSEDTMDLQLIKAIIQNNIGVCFLEQGAGEDAEKLFCRSLGMVPAGAAYDDPAHYLQLMRRSREV